MDPNGRLEVLRGIALALVPALLLAACGGGGGGGGSNTPPPPTYSVGGTVTGLAGTGLVLQNNAGGNLTIAAAGNFTFANRLAGGAAYGVTVLTQPDNPSQTCSVSGGAGNVAAADITSVVVTCITNSFTVGGSVTGLAGTGLTLSLNGGTDLIIPGNGNFVFPQAVLSGAPYEVRISNAARSPAQSCTLAAGSGTMASANVTSVNLQCVTQHARYALVTDRLASTLSSFAVDSSSGRLSLRDYATTELGAMGVTVDTAGARVYVANQNADEITAYTLDQQTGALEQVLGSPFTAGDAPQQAIIDPSGRFLVSPNLLSGNLSVFSIVASSGALTPVAGSPFALNSAARPGAAAFDPAGRFLFAADAEGDGIWSYSMDANTGALLAVSGSPFVNGIQNPVAMEVTRDGRFLIVANSVSNDLSVFAVNAANGALSPVTGSPFTAGAQPASLALDPSGRFLYVANRGADNLYTYAIDRSTGVLSEIIAARISTGDEPSGLRLDPTGAWLVVTNERSSTVGTYGIDATSGMPTHLRTQATRRGASSIALTTHSQPTDIAARHAYVAHFESDTVSVLAIDATSGAVELQGAAVPTGDGPLDVAIHPHAGYAYVTNRLADTIQAYTIREDGSLEPSGAPTPGGAGAIKLLIEPSARFAYGANIDAGTLTVYDVDAASGRLAPRTPELAVGLQLQSLAMDPAGQYLYAGTLLTPRLQVFRIDHIGGGLVPVGTPLDMAADVYSLAVDASGTRLYATSLQADTVTSFAINRSTGALTALGSPVVVAASPRAVASRPGGAEVYTANFDTDTFSRLQQASSGELSLATNHPGRDGAAALAIEGEGRYLFITNYLQGTVSSYDVSSGAPQEVDAVALNDEGITLTLRETVALTAGP
jgi:6-phosphogluconolactonase